MKRQESFTLLCFGIAPGGGGGAQVVEVQTRFALAMVVLQQQIDAAWVGVVEHRAAGRYQKLRAGEAVEQFRCQAGDTAVVGDLETVPNPGDSIPISCRTVRRL